MPMIHMIFWSIILTIALGLWRLRNWRQTAVVAAITIFILMLSQSLFVQLALSGGLDPTSALTTPEIFLASGLFGWLALLVMPCGWLGPIVGFHLVQHWQTA
jgi:lipopolysaccharide export LptBFGC system permease protein LptF